MTRERVIIIANGQFNDLDFYKNEIKENDYIICADGGTNQALAMGITPQLVIGDLDSIDEKVFKSLARKKTKIVTFPKEKDESDLELALLEACKRQPREIIIMGALGKRVDHLMANLMILTLPLKKGTPTKIIDEVHEIFLVDKQLELAGEIGDFLSLFPLSADVKGITTQGLKYPLEDETLYLGPTRGLSNEFIETRAKITIREGLLLAIKVKKDLGFFK